MGTNKGGVRVGSGRPAIQDGGAKQRSVSLRDSDIAFFTDLGEGNLSAGIRFAADALEGMFREDEDEKSGDDAGTSGVENPSSCPERKETDS